MELPGSLEQHVLNKLSSDSLTSPMEMDSRTSFFYDLPFNCLC